MLKGLINIERSDVVWGVGLRILGRSTWDYFEKFGKIDVIGDSKQLRNFWKIVFVLASPLDHGKTRDFHTADTP
jgi:hypothetical protein